ncbi:GGDEF domain-containing protein, partial [Clostridium sp.]|uniref:GGDEF domain-containing protein n=1 Tax=Clostridium sp. TaxID=1506 RepID=UPI00321750B2
AGFLIINASFIDRGRAMYDEFTISMNNWTYYTDYNSTEKKATLPWLIDSERANETVYMNSIIPKIDSNQCLLIDSYMKNIKVYINGRSIYESDRLGPESSIKSIGRGLYFVDIPAAYSESTIKLEVTSSIPKSKGIIYSVSLGDKATHITNLVKEYGLKNAIAIFMILMGIIVIIIYIASSLKSRGYINLACFGAFALTFGVWIIGNTSLYQVIYNNSYFGYILESCAYYFIPIPLTCFILSNYRVKNKNILIGVIITFLIFFIIKITSLVLYVLGLGNFWHGASTYNVILILGILIIAYILIVEIIRKNRDVYIFSSGCFFMIICCVLDLIKFYCEPLKEIGGTYILGVIVFMISIGLTIARYIIRMGHNKIKDIELKRLAYRDISTGVFNRTKFDEDMNSLNKEIGTDIDVCIIVIDVDNLKKTNDTEGHLEGDRLIIETAAILQNSFNEAGKVYRIGGDEFVVMLVNQDKKTIEECEKKRKEMVKTSNSMTCKHLAMSCGKSSYIKGQDANMYCVFERADRLMYENKRVRKKK